MDSMVNTTLIIEREIDDAHSIRDAGTSDKKRGSQVSSLGLGKKQRTSVPRGSQGQDQPSQEGGTFGLLANQDRGCVSSATSLDTIDGIAPRDRDPRVMGHHSHNHQ